MQSGIASPSVPELAHRKSMRESGGDGSALFRQELDTPHSTQRAQPVFEAGLLMASVQERLGGETCDTPRGWGMWLRSRAVFQEAAQAGLQTNPPEAHSSRRCRRSSSVTQAHRTESCIHLLPEALNR
ncbi:hypothetical protein DPEC_G00049680 [Dallia pectoralis]|uniref:Uncharacterized protein n=1 Tax=Dallia pectoralis TaxID=75939 RepID=A0ACC2HBL2_DALPE|nr:hypothetical protein DPEC_G00049680 [Dallia pectoralis]